MPSNHIGTFAKVWTFESSSSSKTYQTILYVSGATSCDCPGWTRQVKNGQRTCKHCRAVEMGTADRTAIASKNYAAVESGKAPPKKPTKEVDEWTQPEPVATGRVPRPVPRSKVREALDATRETSVVDRRVLDLDD